MSSAVGAVSCSNSSMWEFYEEKEEQSGDEREGNIKISTSDASLSTIDRDEEDDATFELGPQYTLKEQLEKDKVENSAFDSMSSAVGAVSGSNSSMGEFYEEKEEQSGDEREWNIKRSTSDASLSTIDQDEEEDDASFELGPQYTLKEQLEKDKDDESLRRWKEQLLGAVDINNVGESADPEVKIISLFILSPGRPAIVLPIPEDGKPKGLWFTLKEGSPYSLRFSFQVSNNIVVGFRYTNNVWKTGIKVDSEKLMLGTFSPQPEPYTFDVPEETTPSGYFARGQYSAKSKFVDDDNKCYLEIQYTFDIRKDWAKS